MKMKWLRKVGRKNWLYLQRTLAHKNIKTTQLFSHFPFPFVYKTFIFFFFFSLSRNETDMNPIFRSDSHMGMGMGMIPYTTITEVEKRRLFLKSYQFSRKQTAGQRMKRSLFRVKKLIWIKLRSAKKIQKMIWYRLRHGFFFNGFRRKRFIRLNHHNNNNTSICFW